LEETPIDCLSYPLNNRRRGVCPGGGLFSTASDLALFCRMILEGGSLDGRHYLSSARVKEMTSVHTGDLYFEEGRTDSGWGLGWRVMRLGEGPDGPVSEGSFGHGGAYATNMWIDPPRGLITIFLVQRADFPAAERVAAIAAFRQAAIAVR
jgi:CubicO group peptidase (beta-lactamase class C family)